MGTCGGRENPRWATVWWFLILRAFVAQYEQPFIPHLKPSEIFKPSIAWITDVICGEDSATGRSNACSLCCVVLSRFLNNNGCWVLRCPRYSLCPVRHERHITTRWMGSKRSRTACNKSSWSPPYKTYSVSVSIYVGKIRNGLHCWWLWVKNQWEHQQTRNS